MSLPRLSALTTRGWIVLGSLLLAACHQRPAERIDLSCDIIQYDAALDSSRVEYSSGTVVDSGLLALGRGRLVLRVYAYAGSAEVDRVIRVVLTPAHGGNQIRRDSDSSQVMLDIFPGSYGVHVTCMGCSRADTSIGVEIGRADTLDAYLGRFPANCELPPKR